MLWRAGTGKTHVLAARVVSLLQQPADTLSNSSSGGGKILALTFTRAAAHALQQRVEVAVPIDRVAYHGHGGLEYEVCTLHSWAWQIIQVRDCTLAQPAASQRSSHC